MEGHIFASSAKKEESQTVSILQKWKNAPKLAPRSYQSRGKAEQ